jgi:hypothetical protein
MSTTNGRYIVARHWHRWAVQDSSWNPPKVLTTHNHQAGAQAHADRLNQPPARTPSAHQDALFTSQEVAS